MIRIPVTLKDSPIHGTGVFAARDIPKGEVVWLFSRIFDHLISEHLWVRASTQEKAKLFERGYRHPDYPADFYMCGDEGQFLNFPHPGEESNLELGPMVNTQPVLRARRDIKAGEELTVPPESDADYERKMKGYSRTEEVARPPSEMPTLQEVQAEASKMEGSTEVQLGGIRDGEDVK
jgi:SET domain-containing protein